MTRNAAHLCSQFVMNTASNIAPRGRNARPKGCGRIEAGVVHFEWIENLLTRKYVERSASDFLDDLTENDEAAIAVQRPCAGLIDWRKFTLGQARGMRQQLSNRESVDAPVEVELAFFE